VLRSRRDIPLLILGGFFLTNGLLGEFIGGKLLFLVKGMIGYAFLRLLILAIASHLPGKIPGQQFLSTTVTQSVYKFSVAVLLIALMYVGHSAAERFVGRELAEQDAGESRG
jgi:uncharacterized membrane protein